MIQAFGQRYDGRVTRRGLGVVLAFWLNLILLPCAMAIEAPEVAHDCCPPTIAWQQLDCCEIDGVAPDKRSSKFEFQNDAAIAALTFIAIPRPQRSLRPAASPVPPAAASPPLHKLYCVYLD